MKLYLGIKDFLVEGAKAAKWKETLTLFYGTVLKWPGPRSIVCQGGGSQLNPVLRSLISQTSGPDGVKSVTKGFSAVWKSEIGDGVLVDKCSDRGGAWVAVGVHALHWQYQQRCRRTKGVNGSQAPVPRGEERAEIKCERAVGALWGRAVGRCSGARAKPFLSLPEYRAEMVQLLSMAGVYDLIKDVYPGNQSWMVKARIIRLWEMCPMEQPDNPLAIEMVMIDAQGGKIQPTIRKPMIRKFRGALVEGHVYRMILFGVVKNTGSYKACRHEFKLLFHGKTRVVSTKGFLSPYFMGILFAVSSEKTFVRNGGKISCTMFGEYVDAINVHLAEEGAELLVIVVQLGRVKTYKGDITIQNVVNTTKIIWNPDIPEVQAFKNRVTLNGFEIGASTMVIGEGYKELPLKDDFLGFSSMEDNPRATCYRKACCINVDHVTPRFKLKLEVFDGEDTAALILFDSDVEYLLGKSCVDLLAEAEDPDFGDHPLEFGSIMGRELIFKVYKGPEHAFRLDDTFRVRRICDDPSIIGIFKDNSVAKTLEKAGNTNLKKKKNLRLKKVKIERD
ncbi:Nucleic acid-binding, OB-fold [Sesbania bispinosa]|nr:Nucleic acid-binding, OB-fold [Sesbania bispinosa]